MGGRSIAKSGWGVSTKISTVLPVRKRGGTHCTGRWVGLSDDRMGFEKSFPHWGSNLRWPSPLRVAILTMLSWPEICYGLALGLGMNCVTVILYRLAFKGVACKTVAWYKMHQNLQNNKIDCIQYILKLEIPTTYKCDHL